MNFEKFTGNEDQDLNINVNQSPSQKKGLMKRNKRFVREQVKLLMSDFPVPTEDDPSDSSEEEEEEIPEEIVEQAIIQC
jgi:hypothetical protein